MKLYVSVVTLSTPDNIKLLKKLESRFKRTISWNKYVSKTTKEGQNRYLDFLIDASFQRVNRHLFCHLKMNVVKKVTGSIIFQLQKQKIIMS